MEIDSERAMTLGRAERVVCPWNRQRCISDIAGLVKRSGRPKR